MIRQKPGQYYYVYQPLKPRGWENHPFTLATWSSSALEVACVPQSSATVNDKETGSSASPTTSSPPGLLEVAGRRRLSLWIRPLDGWTRRLRDECMATDVLHPSIFIEGPYGEATPLHDYDSLLMIAGGSGFSAIFAYLQDYMARRGTPRSGTTTTRTRAVRLIWTAKRAGLIRDIASRELHPILAREDVDTSLFYTSPETVLPDVDSKSSGDEKDLELTAPSSHRETVGLVHRRPDVTATVLEAAERASSPKHSTGKLGIIVCGPVGMADEARAAVHRALKQGWRNVSYVEEAFA